MGCLDTLDVRLVVRVHCVCENDNLCARCGQKFHARKLNANYYEPADRTSWHVPGFSDCSDMSAPNRSIE